MSMAAVIRRLRTDQHGVYTPLRWTPAVDLDVQELKTLRAQRATLEAALAVLIEHGLKPGQDELIAGIVKIERDAAPIEQRIKEAP